MKKVGLIIQGPLISFGKSGRTATRQPFLSSEGIEEDGLVRYDCRSNIQKIINDFGKFNFCFICYFNNFFFRNCCLCCEITGYGVFFCG